jgi:hypothetical protein
VGKGVFVAVGGAGVALGGKGDEFVGVTTDTGGVPLLPVKVQAAIDNTSRRTNFSIFSSLSCASAAMEHTLSD